MMAAEMGHTFEVEGFPRGHMSKGKQSTKELWESNLLPFMGENPRTPSSGKDNKNNRKSLISIG